jgi:hypothetical protein
MAFDLLLPFLLAFLLALLVIDGISRKSINSLSLPSSNFSSRITLSFNFKGPNVGDF